MTRGCPQGSVLGPLLWLIIAETYLNTITSTDNFSTFAYADDFLFVFSGTNWNKISTLQQQEAIGFENWLTDNALTLSKSKTTATLILYRPFIPPKKKPAFKFFNNSIEHTPTFTFLGVTFAYTLFWTQHIANLQSKTLKINNSWSKITSKLWGVSSSTLRIWYHTVVEKICTYAAGVWGNNLSPAQQLHLIQIQRPFLIKITRSYISAPSSGLCLLAKTVPLHLAVKREALIQRTLRFSIPSSISGITLNPLTIETKAHPLLIHPSTFHLNNFHLNSKNLPLTEFNIYTDGSKTTYGVGSAFVVYKSTHEIFTWAKKLPSHATIFQAEVIAISEAITWIKQNGNSPTIIHTDSQSAIKAISSRQQRILPIQHIQEQILSDNRIHINWVRGHTGILGNEHADSLARNKANEKTDDFYYCLQSITYIKHLINSITHSDWQLWWDYHPKSRSLHSLLPKIDIPTFVSLPSQTAFLINHGPFVEYLHRIGSLPSPLCVCGKLGTSLHYATECPLTSKWHIVTLTDNNRTLWAIQLLQNKSVIKRLFHLYKWLLLNVNDLVHT